MWVLTYTNFIKGTFENKLISFCVPRHFGELCFCFFLNLLRERWNKMLNREIKFVEH